MVDVAPLTGIKIVDMTEALAGPYCAMLLGDLGVPSLVVERHPGTAIHARAGHFQLGGSAVVGNDFPQGFQARDVQELRRRFALRTANELESAAR